MRIIKIQMKYALMMIMALQNNKHKDGVNNY